MTAAAEVSVDAASVGYIMTGEYFFIKSKDLKTFPDGKYAFTLTGFRTSLTALYGSLI